MAKDTVKTSILIISDTHAGAPHGAFGATSPPLPPADLLIHCGDLTMTGAAAEYEQTLDMLARIEAPVKLVIAGNHDLTLDGEFMQSHAGDARILSSSSSGHDDAEARWKAARALWTDPAGRAAREGVTFLDEGTHRVALANGAGQVRVIAGQYDDVSGPAHTFSPLNVWDLQLNQGHDLTLRQPEGWSTALVVLEGEVIINGSESAREGQLAVLSQAGDAVHLEATAPAKVLLMAGEPLQEPIVGYGPFVMNNKTQIAEAVRDFNSGRFGQI